MRMAVSHWNSFLLISLLSFDGFCSLVLFLNNIINTEDDVEEPSSPSVAKAEEEGITVVHEVKCKLYVKVK